MPQAAIVTSAIRFIVSQGFVDREKIAMDLPVPCGLVFVQSVSAAAALPARGMGPSATWRRVPEGVAGVGLPGDAWVMVETSIDLRASPAWMQLDGALGQMAGSGAAAPPAVHPSASSEDCVSDPGAGHIDAVSNLLPLTRDCCSLLPCRRQKTPAAATTRWRMAREWPILTDAKGRTLLHDMDIFTTSKVVGSGTNLAMGRNEAM